MPKFLILFICAMALRAEPAETADRGVDALRILAREARGGPGAARAQLELARALLDAGRLDEAFAENQAVIEAFDEPAARNRALAGQGRARFGQGRFAEAARLFQRAADGAEDTPGWRAEWLSRAADAVSASGRHMEAARMYRRVYTLFPDNAPAGEMLLRTADALARAGETQVALDVFTRAEEVDPALAAESRARQCEFLARQGEVAACAKLAGHILAQDGGDAAVKGRALLAMARALCAANEFEEALYTLVLAEKIPETADEAAWLRVAALKKLGRGEDARGAAEMLRANNGPFAQEARFWLLRDAYNAGRFDDAMALADEFAGASPRDARVAVALVWSARAAALAGDLDRTVDDIGRLRRVPATDECLSEGVFVQGVALMGLGRFEEAARVFDDLLIRHPESAWTTAAWLRKGDALYLLGAGRDAWFDAAAAAYGEALLRYDITPAARLEASYKHARALERANHAGDAPTFYTAGVAAPFLDSWQAGPPATADGAGWFSRAVFRAADLLVSRGETGAALEWLGRVADANAPGADEAVERRKKVKEE
ncbi:MAG: tetratricopeptide repeat protein [Kiritimatiellaeota bacterium]|nr:tetratricopeptide repeat protein [Kiritimatiellota bacterium]